MNIDLSKFIVSSKWEEALSSYKYLKSAQKCAERAYKDIIDSCGGLGSKVDMLLGIGNKLKFLLNIRRRHLEELKLLSSYSDTGKQLVFSNLLYELTKYGEYKTGAYTWCSSAAKWTSRGMVHARNMDWPLNILKGRTMELNFHGATAGSFTSITFPGYTGILTGIAPERFSASINMMCEDYGVSLRGKPVSFLLREMFEQCEDYDEAVEFLEGSDVFAPALIHLVGIDEGENAVVGVMPKEYENFTYEDDGSGLCITNHIPDSDFDDEEYDVDSVERLDFLNEEIENVKSMDAAHRMMRKIRNEDTKHTVTMCASTGEYMM